jgi:hypothetical protein
MSISKTLSTNASATPFYRCDSTKSRLVTKNIFFLRFFMNKLIAALIAGLFATAAFAQTPASSAAPMAASSTAKKATTKKATVKKSTKAKKMKAASTAMPASSAN